MKVVNFFGGPSFGKSTTALGLTHFLKKKYFANCEYVSEYAKQLTWEGHLNILEQDQLFITANQNRSLMRLLGKVDIAITDSPLLLGINYKTPDSISKSYENLVVDQFNFYNNINYLLVRNPNKPYISKGRNQTLEEALKIGGEIEEMLHRYNIPHSKIFIETDTEEKLADYLYNSYLK